MTTVLAIASAVVVLPTVFAIALMVSRIERKIDRIDGHTRH